MKASKGQYEASERLKLINIEFIERLSVSTVAPCLTTMTGKGARVVNKHYKYVMGTGMTPTLSPWVLGLVAVIMCLLEASLYSTIYLLVIIFPLGWFVIFCVTNDMLETIINVGALIFKPKYNQVGKDNYASPYPIFANDFAAWLAVRVSVVLLVGPVLYIAVLPIITLDEEVAVNIVNAFYFATYDITINLKSLVYFLVIAFLLLRVLKYLKYRADNVDSVYCKDETLEEESNMAGQYD